MSEPNRQYFEDIQVGDEYVSPGRTVTEAEVGDDGAAYGVEVRKDDGTQVEVRLDETFSVIGSEIDDE